MSNPEKHKADNPPPSKCQYAILPEVDLSQSLNEESSRYALDCFCLDGDKLYGTDGRILIELTLGCFMSSERVLLPGEIYLNARKMMLAGDFYRPRLILAKAGGSYFLICDRCKTTPGEIEYFRLPWNILESKFPEFKSILDPPDSHESEVTFTISAKVLTQLANLMSRSEFYEDQGVTITAKICNGGFDSLSFATKYTGESGTHCDLRGILMLYSSEDNSGQLKTIKTEA